MLTFDAIKGHQDIVKRLSAAIIRGKIASAYLFYGPEGIGKFCTAKAFSRALNCPEGGGRDCGVCAVCRRVDAGAHPDVHFIDEGYGSEIKIESVRQLQQEISLRPYEARYKTFVINDSHNLNTVSANALLKTLEDTPAQSLIVLVTDKPRLMPQTIVSRCRRENFRPLGRDDFRIALRDEGFDRTALDYLAYFCEGRLGPARRLKDSPILAGKNRVIDSFLSGSLDDSLKREEIRRELAVVIAWFRDVYLTKLGLAGAINGDREPDLRRCSARYGFDELERIFKQLSSAFLYLEQNVNTKLLLANLRSSLRV